MKAGNNITVVNFTLDEASKLTLQNQIQQRIVDGILSGHFPSEARLPSTRELAEHLNISRITVTIAYNDLVANDYLYSRGRSGYYVSPTAPRNPAFAAAPPQEDCNLDWSKRLASVGSARTDLLRPQHWHDFEFNFIYGQADEHLISHHNWRKSAFEALGRRDFEDLIQDRYQYDDPMLLKYIIEYSLPKRGIFVSEDEVLTTVGAQNALWMSTQLLLGPDRKATLENPCYHQLAHMVEYTRCTSERIDIDNEGLNPAHITADTDLVYTTASHQCPTSTTMPTHRRRELLKRAQQDDFIIIEDDYEFETPYFGSPKPSLKSLDTSGRVIYIGSFSKSMFPGLRLGFLVAAPDFIREARALRSLMLRHPPSYIQRTVAYFLSLGFYDTQMKHVERAHRKRHRTMVEAINRYGLTLAGDAHSGGSSFWMKVDERIDTEELANRLYAQRVLIEPGHSFFAKDQPQRNYYRIAYSSISSTKIDEGIRLISYEIALMLDELD